MPFNSKNFVIRPSVENFIGLQCIISCAGIWAAEFEHPGLPQGGGGILGPEGSVAHYFEFTCNPCQGPDLKTGARA